MFIDEYSTRKQFGYVGSHLAIEPFSARTLLAPGKRLSEF